jgi:flagellar assembly protein FliH
MSFTRHQAVGIYRPWVPPAFDAPRSPAGSEAERPDSPPTGGSADEREADPAQTSESVDDAQSIPAVRLPTVDEIEQIHDEARQSGFEAGFGEGREAGYGEGREIGLAEGREAGFAEGRVLGLEEGRQNGYAEGKASADGEAARLRELFVNLERALTRFDAEVGEELMALAIEIARKVLQHTLVVAPETILDVIRTALAQLPQGQAEIHVNSSELALIRKHLDELASSAADYLLVADDSISPGGCRIEAAGAQLDVTMETRWRRVLDSLGRKHAPWAQPGKSGVQRARRKQPSAPESAGGARKAANVAAEMTEAGEADAAPAEGGEVSTRRRGDDNATSR